MQLILDFILLIPYALYHILESLVLWFIPNSWRAKDVSDDIVLITGGGSGIGQQLAYRFAKLGSTIVIWDINEKGMAKTVKDVNEMGAKIFSFVCDISKREEVYKVAEKTKAQVGVVTILVNNAGIVTGKSLLESPDDMIQKTFEINTIAHFWTVKAFLPDMISVGKGHIVTIASLAGFCGVNKMVDYCSSKHAAVGFDESLHMELRESGVDNIKTTVVCPYYINTGMFEGTKTRFVPMMTTEYVVDNIISSILANERILILPRFLYIVVFVKYVLPWKTYLYVTENIAQLHRGLSAFKGRKQE